MKIHYATAAVRPQSLRADVSASADSIGSGEFARANCVSALVRIRPTANGSLIQLSTLGPGCTAVNGVTGKPHVQINPSVGIFNGLFGIPEDCTTAVTSTAYL